MCYQFFLKKEYSKKTVYTYICNTKLAVFLKVFDSKIPIFKIYKE